MPRAIEPRVPQAEDDDLRSHGPTAHLLRGALLKDDDLERVVGKQDHAQEGQEHQRQGERRGLGESGDEETAKGQQAEQAEPSAPELSSGRESDRRGHAAQSDGGRHEPQAPGADVEDGG